MEEFVENLNTFRNWLYKEGRDSKGIYQYAIQNVINKFKELKLDDAF